MIISYEQIRQTYVQLIGVNLADEIGNPEAREYLPEWAKVTGRLVKTGQHEKAVDLLLQLAEDHKDNAWIQHRLGIVLRMSGDPQRALVHYANALQLDSEIQAGVAHYCYVLHMLGKSVDAVNILNLRLILKPTDKDSANVQRKLAWQMNNAQRNKDSR